MLLSGNCEFASDPFWSRRDNEGDKSPLGKDGLLDCNIVGLVCAFFPACPIVCVDGLVLGLLFPSKYVLPASKDSWRGEVTKALDSLNPWSGVVIKLNGRESLFEYSSSPYRSPIASVTWWLVSLMESWEACPRRLLRFPPIPWGLEEV
jgi:hypothetical protein